MIVPIWHAVSPDENSFLLSSSSYTHSFLLRRGHHNCFFHGFTISRQSSRTWHQDWSGICWELGCSNVSYSVLVKLRASPLFPSDTDYSLYGVTCLQTFIYFKKEQRDSLIFRLVVRSVASASQYAWISVSISRSCYFGTSNSISEKTWILLEASKGTRYNSPRFYHACHLLLHYYGVRKSCCATSPNLVWRTFLLIVSVSHI